MDRQPGTPTCTEYLANDRERSSPVKLISEDFPYPNPGSI